MKGDVIYQLGVEPVVPSLDSQMGDQTIESRIGRVDKNFPRDPDPTTD